MTSLHVNVVLYVPDDDTIRTCLTYFRAIAEEVAQFNVLISGPATCADVFSKELRKKETIFAMCQVLHRFDNPGFAGGHNRLLELAFAAGADFVLVANPDLLLEPGAISRLLSKSRGLLDYALIAPTIRRATDELTLSDQTDSLGIRWTIGARHFDIGHGDSWSFVEGEPARVLGVTGACMLTSAAVHRRIVSASGYFFDPLFIAYREDAELGVRADLLDVPSYVVPVEGFAHVRTVRGAQRNGGLVDLLGVRNRFLIRWRLGSRRPGNPIAARLRDAVVYSVVHVRERSSIAGLREAHAIRRYVTYSSAFRSLSGADRAQSKRTA